MATQSFYRNVIIKKDEDVRRLEQALDQAEKRGRYHTEDCSDSLKKGEKLLERRQFV
ncbi:MAG: hypothetical protein PWQ62_1236 [Candidatus Methanomethylophilaceae archaeon]|nr:hypothetical protein [Candidatus Methanomethylophilaceae archaeon]